MATNDFIGFASSGSANVLSQAEFAAAAEQGAGVQPGMASSKLANKVWRQGANMAAALGRVIVGQGHNAIDNGDLIELQSAIESSFQTRKRQSFNFTANTIDLTVSLGEGRNYVCGNIIQISQAFTVTAVSAAGWYTIATADLSSMTDLTYSDAFFAEVEHIGQTAAIAHRDRIIQANFANTSGLLALRAYLYAADSGINLRPSIALVASA